MRLGIYYSGINMHRNGSFIVKPLAVAFVLAAVGLSGCASRSDRAPVVDLTQKPAASQTTAASASGSYVVRPGDTLYSIAGTHNMNVARLTQLNNITDPSQLKVGQVLKTDGNADTSTVVIASTGSTPKEDASKSQQEALASKEPDQAAQSVDTAKASTDTQRATDAAIINWGWPGNGKIIQGFNASTKGIDLEGNIGEPVVAAADGKVMYAGNGVKGLGNLILLGHTDGFITAYAHNHELLVQTGQEVKKGSKIATLGSTDTNAPMLHFEIRRRGTPVNPLSYLPVR